MEEIIESAWYLKYQNSGHFSSLLHCFSVQDMEHLSLEHFHYVLSLTAQKSTKFSQQARPLSKIWETLIKKIHSLSQIRS